MSVRIRKKYCRKIRWIILRKIMIRIKIDLIMFLLLTILKRKILRVQEMTKMEILGLLLLGTAEMERNLKMGIVKMA